MSHDIKPNATHALVNIRVALKETNPDSIADGLSHLLSQEIGEGFIADYVYLNSDTPAFVKSSSDPEEGELFSMGTAPEQYGQQVLIVKIIENGSDVAVFFNGQYVFSAAPGCGDSVDTVYEVAAALAVTHNVTIEEVEHKAREEWQWSEIEHDLKMADRIRKPVSLNDKDVYAVCVQDPNYQENWQLVRSSTNLARLDENAIKTLLGDTLCISEEDRVFVGCVPGMPVINLDNQGDKQ